MFKLLWLLGGTLVTVGANQLAGLPGMLIVTGVLLMILAFVLESK